jgi:uncharacterized lipoprotein
MRTHRTLALAVAVAAGGLIVAGCSTSNTVDKADVESQAEEQLAAQVDADVTPDVSCPDDLDAEEGATMECELTVEGDDTVYPVSIEVTSVEDDTANFSIEVGDPAGGDTTTTTAG